MATQEISASALKHAQQNYLEGLQYAILEARATRLVIEDIVTPESPESKDILRQVDELVVRMERRAEEMKELIAVSQSKLGEGWINTVNARDLYTFLEAKKDFSTWIKDRIEKYGFTENQDYICSPVLGSEGRGGQNRIDYHTTIDMAKELSMVERNEKGKEARLYFIECEKVAKQQPTIDPIKVLNDPAAMRGLLLTYSEKVLALEETVKAQAPKVAALKRITLTEGEFNITTAAKLINVRPKVLFEYLSTNGYIYRRLGGKEWVAYQVRVQQGLLLHKTLTVMTPDCREKVIERCLVTPKGLAHIAEIFTTKPQQHISGARKSNLSKAVIQ